MPLCDVCESATQRLVLYVDVPYVWYAVCACFVRYIRTGMRIELVKFEFGHLLEAARSETALVCPRLSSLWTVLLLPVVRMAAGALAGLLR